MTTVINLWGEPSVGKSTLAAEIYAQMKKDGYKVELVREFAKELVWEGKQIGPFDQMAIIGEQIRRESSLFGKVDYIITDSPALLGAFYMAYNHNQDFMTDMVKKYMDYADDQEVLFKNYLLNRARPYERNGRIEDQAQAEVMRENLVEYMKENITFEDYLGLDQLLYKDQSLAW